MHAVTPRTGIQTTIFSEHEVFVPFRYFCKKSENNEKNMSFN